MSASVVDVLRAARAKIEAPERWTRGVFARNKDGNVCNSRGASAVCFCALGAIRSVSESDLDLASATDLLERAAMEMDPAVGESVVMFNDNHDHGEVLRAFDRAIELAGGTS